ncbi:MULTISPECIES: 5-carboxymethyl-2-hydroxymuconate Delta-isomerase [unclassified Oceanobacter]|uniref:5-carboxymethyl-2-hydroxymuconate Delta-isomerase n=1 Tax=unclassified Oceanobacter TaxID=2620260 RepID=UPI00273298BF|nr:MULTISPECIES: 5-carboxymethyl-2-hydroxymuconate Delta-isomerase [unclassified Oceanobacter]MDP2504499.1 5-carboxymethyl-2-hydroxymuconate Delta-isomerase [Oceanobacter sp. 3_MG-2023]MDP2547047.1 5-carboxymethyl-2-hydroxymuconate Delta-isomerase [Oceanobacter sp. 4_MG-2023]
MPHLVIEYARVIEQTTPLRPLMQQLFEAACQGGIIQPQDIKVRAMPYDHFLLRRDDETFLHITLSLLEGRTDQQKEQLAINLRQVLAEQLPDVTSLSIDIRDMNATAYKKRLLPLADAD